MNENPGETPNPLNPMPETGASPEPVNSPSRTGSAGVAPAEDNATTNQTPTGTAVGAFTEAVQVESLDPMGRPMEKAAPQTEAPKKKSKVGLIVCLVILIVALIGGGIAAAVVLMNKNKPDAVAMAMEKLMSGEAPENVAIDGTIDILLNDKDSPVSRINVNLDSDIIVGSAINTSSVVLTMTTRYGQDYSVKFDEVYAANGDLYFKIDGAMAAIEDSGILDLIQNSADVELNADAEELDADTEGTVEVVDSVETIVDTAYVDVLAQAIEVIDGEWLKISTDELAQLSSDIMTDSPTTCIMNMVGDLNKNSNTTVQLYNKYPFINSTTEGVMIASKENPVYRVSINSENFAQFVNSMQNAGLTDDLYTCLGWKGNTSVSEEDAAEVVNELPKAYVEVNGNNEFSRLYVESELNDGAMSVVADLGLNYPRNVNVMEPVEYTDFSEVIQKIMSGMFSISEDAAETVIVAE